MSPCCDAQIYPIHMIPNFTTIDILGQRISGILVTMYLPNCYITSTNPILYPQLVDLNVSYLTYAPSLGYTDGCASVRMDSDLKLHT